MFRDFFASVLIVTLVKNELDLALDFSKLLHSWLKKPATVCSQLIDNFIGSFFNSKKFSNFEQLTLKNLKIFSTRLMHRYIKHVHKIKVVNKLSINNLNTTVSLFKLSFLHQFASSLTKEVTLSKVVLTP